MAELECFKAALTDEGYKVIVGNLPTAILCGRESSALDE